VTVPDPDNVQHWYFIVFGLADEAYKGGYYLGCIYFPDDYPFKAPTIKMLVDTGRFKTGESICLSITHHHQESWDPIWSATAIITGLLSMMNQEEVYYFNFINNSYLQRRRIADASKNKVIAHPKYRQLFQ